MENMVENTEHNRRRRKGQAMAEFALTLPIVLILMFGIIEFGRIFQAWVTLQNSARAAARYASTGIYNTSRYVINTTLGTDDPTGLVPCMADTYTAGPEGPGTLQTVDPNPSTPGDEVEIYLNGPEWLFATFYDGTDCDPGNSDHQDMRKDILRLLSIMDEARVGAAGLSLEAPPTYTMQTWQSTPLNDVWVRPLPRSNQRSWFNTMICSTRDLRFQSPQNPPSTTYFDRDTPSGPVETTTRFVTYLGPQEEQLRDQSGNLMTSLPAPACLMNEVLHADIISAGGTSNAARPWLDAGGPGDAVSIVITFNHPLITPLGLADYIPIQARRVAINESFRASRAINALNTGPGSGIVPPTPIPTATNTSSPTRTATNTRTNTPQPSATFTASPIPAFQCNLINVTFGSFLGGSTVRFQISNANYQDTNLVRVSLGWAKPAGFNNMYLSQMFINNQLHWQGTDGTSPTNSGPGGPGPEPGDIASADRTVPGVGDGGSGPAVSNWDAKFNNAPPNLGTYLTPSSFTPTEFVFEIPGSTQTCVKQFTAPTPTRTPTLPSNVTATRTPTPDCTTTNISVSFSSFMSFGVVRLLVTNNRNTPAILQGFNIKWISRSSSMKLEQVTAGGSNPADPSSTKVWQAATGQDTTPPTVSPGEGTWLSNYTVDAGASVAIYLDFGGTSSTLSSAFGVQSADFNGSVFNFACPGGSANPVTINNQNTPTPLPTAGPTSTPSNTFTPSITPTITPTTPSPTPGPTNTRTNTPLPPPPTNTATIPPPPTEPGGGSSD